MSTERIPFIDTHTGGEPTRVVLQSPKSLGGGDVLSRLSTFQDQFDDYRRAIVCEPRGSEVMVGALLTDPVSSESVSSVIFFNNVGYLGMCGHGAIGVAIALRHLGKISDGIYRLDTPVGPVQLDMPRDGKVSLQNVPSYRYRKRIPVRLPDGQTVHGDIAWGGNWFFICDDHQRKVELSQRRVLENLTLQIRDQLRSSGVTGRNGEEIDHIELIGPASDPKLACSKNFVLCPGAVYDRSPCGTGTSAKIACLAADGKLAPGVAYRQESIVGSIFEASYQVLEDGKILPTIAGTAHVSAEGNLILDSNDPFSLGIQS